MSSRRKDGAFIKSQRMKEIASIVAKTMPDGSHVDSVLDAIEFGMGLRRSNAELYLDLVMRLNSWKVNEFGIIKAFQGVEP